ncbi:MAG: hypothetical protein AMXMBFR58_22600 [Phycisphaerae bacterium]
MPTSAADPLTNTHPAAVSVTRIEVRPAPGKPDPRGDAVARAASAIGLTSTARSARVYLIEAALTPDHVRRVVGKLLCDPVLETASIGVTHAGSSQVIEIHPLPGVMDPAAQSVESSIRELLGLGADVPLAVSTGWRFDVTGATADQARLLAESSLANRVVHGIHLEPWVPTQLPKGHSASFNLRTVRIRGLNDQQLAAFSREAHLFMSLDEMRAVRDEYERLDRDPTDIELETIAQTWSEHCVHKTLKSKVRYQPLENARPQHSTNEPTAKPASSPRMDFEVSFGRPGAERTVASTSPRRSEDDQSSGSTDPITWSGRPGHTVEPDGSVVIDNLLKRTVAAATFELIDDGIDWTLSVFKDNSGVIAFDDNVGVCVKVETHNRPSAIEPYGGAATGAGGCIRDVIGTGLGAKPIASTDIFCVAHPDHWAAAASNRASHQQPLPPGTLHPRRILSEVVAGVRDYGNRMGIPTVSGTVHFDDRYVGNPLVFCGCIGVIPQSLASGQARPGDRIIALGGRTGRDGIHGATFSSAEVEHTHADEFAHAVQIGNAIEEKRLLDAILKARDFSPASGPAAPLFSAITDCGAGGFSSAVGEMAKDLGATVHLDRAPLKYAGLTYTEIWISEAQERMVLAVPPANVAHLQAICDQEGVPLADLGEFGTADRTLELFYAGTRVGKLSMGFLHDGLPQPVREAVWSAPARRTSRPAAARPTADRLLQLLAHPTIASKHWIIRQYDHEVQGNTVIKPLVGPATRGPGDASVLEPVPGSGKGLAVSCGLATGIGDPAAGGDPYIMALAAIDECVRNLVCVGTSPSRIAILDNFCWPSCEKPENLGALVRAAEGCYDGAKAYRTPFVSGKDSLNNQLRYEDPATGEKKVIEIPPTLLVSGIGIVPSIRRCTTMDAKSSGSVLMLIGRSGPHMSGSIYDSVAGIDHLGEEAAAIPTVDLTGGPATAKAVAQLIQDGLVRSAHDCSDGGLLVAVAEMLIAAYRGPVPAAPSAPQAAQNVDVGAVLQSILKPELSRLSGKPAAATTTSPQIGADLTIWDDMLEADQLAFGEAPSRYVIEIKPDDVQRVRTILRDHGAIPASVIGTLNSTGRLTWTRGAVDLPVADLTSAWLGTLDW